MSLSTLPPLTLVLGGAASGKSAFAEKLIMQSGLERVYVATAEAHDDEMRTKILLHQRQRGPGWLTIEAPLDLSAVLSDADGCRAVLVDCLTMWLTNHFLAGRDLDASESDLIATLRARRAPGPLVMVTNEVGQGIVPDNALSRRFRAAQGRLNRAVAAEADLVVAVMAGLPLALKGTLPS